MPKIKFLDTNYLLRFILNDIPSQADIAENTIRQALLENSILKILPETIIEAIYVLTKVVGKEKGLTIEMLQGFLRISCVHVENKMILLQALELFEVYNVSIEDCYYISYCLHNKIEFLTFDKKAQNIFNKLLT
jgi:predicted nucleic-acid-binding protein